MATQRDAILELLRAPRMVVLAMRDSCVVTCPECGADCHAGQVSVPDGGVTLTTNGKHEPTRRWMQVACCPRCSWDETRDFRDPPQEF